MNKLNKTDTNYIIRVEGKNAFRRGDTFDDFEQVAERMRAHTQESLVYYWKRDSRLVKFAHRKVSRKLNEALQYYSIRFSCIFGGQRFKSKANGLRPCKRQTRQIDCPAFISLRATKCGSKLEVIDVCNDHTHEITEQAVKELPQKRRPSQSLLEEIHELLHLNVDKKIIIEYVKQKENKTILKKDLFNMATHLGLSRIRNEEEQKLILQRIHRNAAQDAIQHAVINRFFQFESNFSLNSSEIIYPGDLKATQETLDIFDVNASSPSAMDFPSLTPQTDLLASTNSTNLEYDELLSNRIVVDYQVEEEAETLEEKPKLEANSSSISENSWNEVSSKSTVIYEDLICGEENGYVYDEFNLTKEIPDQEENNIEAPDSPHLSNDLDDKEDYFNDFILMSPVGNICPTEITQQKIEQDEGEIGEEKDLEQEQEEEEAEAEDVSIKETLPAESVKSETLSKQAFSKAHRRIMRCRSCGTNARLLKMQMSYLRQQRLKLFEETQVLRLKKLKLKAEIEAINSGLM